jgi:hypothetical protein
MVTQVARLSLALAVAGATLAGCASAQQDAASETATAFLTAAAKGDGAGACALLVPDAAGGLETGDTECAQEIVKLGLAGGRAGAAEVWGGNARVQVGADTVFLTRWDAGWRVTAAGCEAQPGRPADCDVEA